MVSKIEYMRLLWMIKKKLKPYVLFASSNQARIFLFFVLRPLRPNKNWPDIKLKYLLSIFFISDGEIYFSKKYEMANFFYKTCKKMENVTFILKIIPSSYIKNLLEIVVKLKLKKCWPKKHMQSSFDSEEGRLIWKQKHWCVTCAHPISAWWCLESCLGLRISAWSSSCVTGDKKKTK